MGGPRPRPARRMSQAQPFTGLGLFLCLFADTHVLSGRAGGRATASPCAPRWLRPSADTGFAKMPEGLRPPPAPWGGLPRPCPGKPNRRVSTDWGALPVSNFCSVSNRTARAGQRPAARPRKGVGEGPGRSPQAWWSGFGMVSGGVQYRPYIHIFTYPPRVPRDAMRCHEIPCRRAYGRSLRGEHLAHLPARQ